MQVGGGSLNDEMTHVRVISESLTNLPKFKLKSKRISLQFIDIDEGIEAALNELINYITRGTFIL